MGRAHEVRAASMAKTAAMKSAKYAKWGKEIYMAAKSGLPDPEMNQTLKKVIERAKKDQCTAQVIERAIAKAKGALSGATKEKVYEGYGAGNVSVIVECLTDNDNRTISEVRNCFNKTGGQLGSTVSYQFERKAIIKVANLDEEFIMNALIDGGADFLNLEEKDSIITITSEPKDFDTIKKSLEQKVPDLEYIEATCTLVPTNYVSLNEEQLEKFLRMLDMLEQLDDVSVVYHNAIINE